MEDVNNNVQEYSERPCCRSGKETRELNLRGSMENIFLQCSKPTLRQSSRLAEQLELEKDVSPVWLCNHHQRANN